MSTGFEIPIGGDMAPFLAVAAQLREEMQKIGKTTRSSLRPISGESRSIAGAMRTAFSGAFNGIVRAAKAAGSMMRSALAMPAKIFQLPGMGLLGLAGGVGALALATSQLSSGLNLAGELERTDIALRSLTGSAATSTAIIGEMRTMWQKTGIDISAQARSIQKFIALGFSSDQAVQLQKNILDVAGAVGMTTEESALLGSALAQVKAKGIVSMEELRQQIAEKGVPVFEALAEKMGVTQGALMKLVADGKVPANELLDIFMNMEGRFGKFVGGAERLGTSYLGMLARLRASWKLLLADFAAPIAQSLKPLIGSMMSNLEKIRPQAVKLGQDISNILIGAFALIQGGKAMDVLRMGFRVAISGAIDLLMRGLRGVVAFLATALPPIFSAAMQTIRDPLFWDGLGRIFEALGQILVAQIARALGKDQMATAATEGSKMNLKQGGMMIAQSGGVDAGAVLADALIEGGKAAGAAVSGPMSDSFYDAVLEWKFAMADSAEEIAAIKAKFAPKADAPGTGPNTQGPAEDSMMGGIKNAMTLTTSLGRVGGGGFGVTFLPMVSEQKRGNNLLKKIADNTANLGAARAPVLA